MTFSFTFIALSFVLSINSAATDWALVRSILISKQTAFNQNNFNEYVFSYRTVSCRYARTRRGYTNTKYNTVQNDKSIDITFNTPCLYCGTCGTRYNFYDTLNDTDYRTINDWFNAAIDYVDTWNGCDGTTTQIPAGSCTNVSLDITYDDTYNFPISIIFDGGVIIDQAAMVYDGGSAWYFDCFDAYSNGIKITDSSGRTYTGSCLYFTPSFLSTQDTTAPVNEWDVIKATLIQQQQIFNGYGFTQYMFSQQQRCNECDNDECTTTKFITITGQDVDVTFDDINVWCSDLYDDDYRTINDWFNVAIDYCEEWMYCDCGDTKTLDITYDNIYGYITEIIFDKEEMKSDGGAMYLFECFTPYVDGEVMGTPKTYVAVCDFTHNVGNDTTIIGPDTTTIRPDTTTIGPDTTTIGPYQTQSNGNRIWFQLFGLMGVGVLFVVW